MKIDINSNNDIFNEPEKIKKVIAQNQKSLFNQKQLDVYRKELLDLERFPIEDYINLEVLQKSTNNKIKLKTYMMLQNKEQFDYPKGVMFMFHGMGAFAGNTANVAKAYANSGLIVCSYDYRGHGNSEGYNGNIESMDDVVSDSKLFIDESLSYIKENIFKSDEKNKEDDNKKSFENFLRNKFLSGISMGGLVAYLISKNSTKDDYKSVIFYAPAFDTYVNPVLKLLSGVIKRFAPNMAIGKTDKFCKNRNYFDNPAKEIEKTSIKIGTAGELLSSIKPIYKERKSYSVPFLMIIPGVDKLCPPQGMFDFYEESISNDKEIWYFPTVWHAIYIEEEIKYILPKVEEYIVKRIN